MNDAEHSNDDAGIKGADNNLEGNISASQNPDNQPATATATTDGQKMPESEQGAQETGQADYLLAKDRGIDMSNPRIGLKIASERLAIVRYVFLVQVEDGIATADQRASLEYADAALVGWPEMDADDVVDLDEDGKKTVAERLSAMEHYIAEFSRQEAQGGIDAMTDLLIRASECVASVRRLYQPDFPIPTFAEIRRVVQDEYDEDMGKIDTSQHATAEKIEEQTEQADEKREETVSDQSQNEKNAKHKGNGKA